MGQSGFRFEDNDMFMDVKATFRERIQDHMTTGDATKAVCEEYEEALADDDDALFVITALADAQMDIGRILVSTQKRCLKAIDYELSGQYDRGWAPEDQEEFTNTLLGFRKLVEQGKRKPQPKRTLARCTWQPGDVYALPLTGKKPSNTASLDDICSFVWLIRSVMAEEYIHTSIFRLRRVLKSLKRKPTLRQQHISKSITREFIGLS